MNSTELEAARRDFSEQLTEWRRSTEKTTGLRLKSRGVWVLLLAGAVGLALGARAGSRAEGND